MKEGQEIKTDAERRKRYRWIGWLLWLFLLCVIAGIAGLVYLQKKKAEQPPETLDAEERATPVRVTELRARRLPDVIHIPGTLEPVVEVPLSTEKPARIVEISVDEGDRVETGQVLLRLDDRIWQTALERAQVQWADAERDQQRWKELEAAGAVAGSEFEDLTVRMEQARIALTEAEIALSKMAVRSPIEGRVEERHADPGAYAMEGMHVFTVVDIDPLILTFDVPERDILFVEEGEQMTFTVSALSHRTFTGEVTFVSARANPANNAFRVECRVDNGNGDMKAGMIARVRLIRSYRENALAVPLAAVVPDRGEHVVFTVEDGRARRNMVILDAILETEVVIGSGLRAGDRIVVEGHRALSDGALVTVQE